MVDEDVALAQDGEEVGGLVAGVGEPGRGHGRPGLLVEVGAVELVDAPQSPEIERGGDGVAIVGPEVELVDQHVPHVVGDVGRHLHTDGPTEPAATQLHLHRGEQVVGLVFVEDEIGVARHPEGVVLSDDHVREQRRQLGGDDLLEGHEALAVGHDHEPGQQRRDLDPGHSLDAGDGIPHAHDEVERQVRDVGEGVPGVDRQGREHREDLAAEDVGQVLTVGIVERRPVRHPDSGLGQTGHDGVEEDGRLAVDELGHALADGTQRLARSQPVRRSGPQAGVDLVLQPRHPHLEELVEALGEDGQELHALQQWHPLVVGEVKEPGPEFQPRQLPVREALRAAGRDTVLHLRRSAYRRRLPRRWTGGSGRAGARRRFRGLHQTSRVPPVGARQGSQVPGSGRGPAVGSGRCPDS